MENRAHAIAAITFLVVFAVGAAALFYWLSSAPPAPRVYRIVTQESVAGLAPQSSVMFKGLKIGHVQSIHFDANKPSRVVITFRVRRNAYITQATYAVLGMKGLIGGKVIKLKLGDGSHAPLTTSAGQPARIPLRQDLIGQLKHAVQNNLEQVHTLLTRVNALLDESTRTHIDSIIANMDALTGKLDKLASHLQPSVQKMPQLLQRMSHLIESGHALLHNTSKLVSQAQAPVQHAAELEQTLQQLGHKLNQKTLPGIHELTRSLTRTSRLLRQLTRELTIKPQSLVFGPPQPPPGPGEPGFNPGTDYRNAHD